MSNKISELYIVGPTASGKSALAMSVAEHLNGEIVCADSQTVRRQLDIGTAKPPKADQEKIKHHMVDIIEPFEDFSVAKFKSLARKCINDIKNKAKLPIIVGGSGMYIDSLFYDYAIGEQKTNYSKSQLEKLSVEELQEIIRGNSWPMPENSQNPRHLIGIIMRGGQVNQNRDSVEAHKLIVGLLPSDEALKQRIHDRTEVMFSEGIVEETRQIISQYGELPKKMDAIAYPIVSQYIEGSITLDDAKEQVRRGDWQYARKQKAWFKRNPHIAWFETQKEAREFIIQTMNKN